MNILAIVAAIAFIGLLGAGGAEAASETWNFNVPTGGCDLASGIAGQSSTHWHPGLHLRGLRRPGGGEARLQAPSGRARTPGSKKDWASPSSSPPETAPRRFLQLRPAIPTSSTPSSTRPESKRPRPGERGPAALRPGQPHRDGLALSEPVGAAGNQGELHGERHQSRQQWLLRPRASRSGLACQRAGRPCSGPPALTLSPGALASAGLHGHLARERPRRLLQSGRGRDQQGGPDLRGLDPLDPRGRLLAQRLGRQLSLAMKALAYMMT